MLVISIRGSEAGSDSLCLGKDLGDCLQQVLLGHSSTQNLQGRERREREKESEEREKEEKERRGRRERKERKTRKKGEKEELLLIFVTQCHDTCSKACKHDSLSPFNNLRS